MAPSRPRSLRASPKTLSASPHIGDLPGPQAHDGDLYPAPSQLAALQLRPFRDEGLFWTVLELGDGGEEPVGAGLHLVGFGIEEDVGSGAFGDDEAVLEGLAGAELEVHGVGAVADGGDGSGAVEDVVEEDRGLVADGGLGDHVPGAGDVADLELLDAHEFGEGAPVGDPNLLEELQVGGVIDVAVGVEVVVPDRDPLEYGRLLQRLLPSGIRARKIVHTLPCQLLV